MNRKGLMMMAVMTVLVVSGAFAELPAFKMSVGAGGYFTSDFGGGYKYYGSIDNIFNEYKLSYTGGGGFAFFDATYAELSLGFLAAGGDLKQSANGKINDTHAFRYTGLDISLLGKYPFALGKHFTLFPLLGINYRYMASVKINGRSASNYGDVASNWSALWFRLGGGADYAFTEHLFMRLGLTYGIRLANKWEKDWAASINSSNTSNPNPNPKTRLGHGLDIKLAAGWRF